MPIVNRDVERQIVEQGRAQGKPDDFIKAAVLRYREKNAPQEVAVEPERGFLDKTSGVIQKGIEAATSAAKATGIPKLGGELVGAAGSIIGGTIGGVLETGKQASAMLKGEGFDFAKISDSIKKISSQTSQFGKMLGEEGVASAPLATVGRIPSGVMAAQQIYEANKNLRNAISSGDKGATAEAALNLTLGVIGARGAIKTKGLILDEAIFPKFANIPNKVKTSVKNSVYEKLTNNAREFLKMTPTQLKKETQFNKNTAKFLVDEGIVDLIDSRDGKIDSIKALEEISIKEKAENDAFRRLLRDSNQYQSINDFKQKALNELRDEFGNRGTDLSKAEKYLDSEIEALLNNKKDVLVKNGNDYLLPVEVFNDIKSGYWQKSGVARKSLEQLDSDINFLLGHTAKDLIELKIDDANIKQLNQRLGDYAQARKLLESANGKTVPGGGYLSRWFARTLSSGAGVSMGGLPGGLIGYVTADKILSILTDPKVKISTWSKIYKNLSKTKEGMTVLQQVEDILAGRAQQRAQMKLLPEGRIYPQGTTENPFIMPMKDYGRSGIIKDANPPRVLPKNVIEGDVIQKGTKALDDVDAHLFEAAKKHESFEEFLKAEEKNNNLIRIFRWQKNGDKLVIEGKSDGVGRPFSKEKYIAEVYGRKGSVLDGFIHKNDVLQYDELDVNTKKYVKSILDERLDNVMREWQEYENYQPYEDLVFELSEIARIKGKKAIDVESFNIPSEREVRVLSADAFKTKSQLFDIWNEAHKK